MKVSAARGASCTHEYSGGLMRTMKGNSKAGYLWKWVRPPLEEKKGAGTSLAVPLRFSAPAELEVNFSSGSTFWLFCFWSVGGSEQTPSS